MAQRQRACAQNINLPNLKHAFVMGLGLLVVERGCSACVSAASQRHRWPLRRSRDTRCNIRGVSKMRRLTSWAQALCPSAPLGGVRWTCLCFCRRCASFKAGSMKRVESTLEVGTCDHNRHVPPAQSPGPGTPNCGLWCRIRCLIWCDIAHTVQQRDVHLLHGRSRSEMLTADAKAIDTALQST